MIKDVDLLFDLDDIGLVPNGQSEPFSISECSLLKDDKLPIFVYSRDIGPRKDITYIIKKDEDLLKRFELMYFTFVSMDFEDFYKYIVNNETQIKLIDEPFYINLDITNVSIKRFTEVIKTAKKRFNDQLVLMVTRISDMEQYEALKSLRVNYALIGNTDDSGNKLPTEDGFVTPYGFLMEGIKGSIRRMEGMNEPRPAAPRPLRIAVDPGRFGDGILGAAGERDIIEEHEDIEEEAPAKKIICEPVFVPFVGERLDRIIKAMALGCRYICLSHEDYIDSICDALIKALYKGRCKTLKEFRDTKIHMISQAVLNSN